MEVIHNKIIAHEGEPIPIYYPITGTLLEGYDSVVMHLRGKDFSEDIDLEIDIENSWLFLNIEEELAPGRYYYDIVGFNKDGRKIPFTDHPLYMEIKPCL